mmetsp:Transcript_21868/g.43384  ORF Transcript_21868/g.43384 Transcript_21868/m.43384 type:complete len:586 (-) Transcript_21868:190-1947(-)
MPKDNTFYELLGVDREATTAQIRKGYYKQARKWHPDKNPDDPTAEDKFKRISEAYQTLTDDNLRAVYDQHGEAGLKQRRDGGEGGLDDVIRAVFGGGAFDAWFGDVTTLSVIKDFMQTEAEDVPEEEKQSREEARRIENEKEEQETCQKLARLLVDRLSPYLTGDKAVFISLNKTEALELCESPGGDDLLGMISYVYNAKGKQNMGRYGGFEGFFSGIKDKGHMVGQGIGLFKHFFNIHKAQSKLALQKQNADDQRFQALVLQHYPQHNVVWSCDQCKTQNAGTSLRCVGCKVTRSNWNCHHCNEENEPLAFHCQSCHTPRPKPPVVLTFRCQHCSQVLQAQKTFTFVNCPTCKVNTSVPEFQPNIPALELQCSHCLTRAQGNVGTSQFQCPNPQCRFIIQVNAQSVPVSATPKPEDVASATLIDDDLPPIQIGTRVTLFGLNSAQYNGVCGDVIDLKEDRWVVKLDNMEKELAVKPTNLKLELKSTDVPEEEKKAMEVLEKKVMSEGLTTMWNFGKMLTEKRVRRVCDMCLASVRKDQKKGYASALFKLAGIYEACSQESKKKNAQEGKTADPLNSLASQFADR